jgi:type I restriction enzyme S subunit
VRWPTESLGAICEIVSGITKDSKKQGDDYREVPYLRVANVQRLQLNLSEVKTIPAKESTIASYRLEPGDILLNEGGDRDKLGRGWIWQGQISECIHQNHVFRARIRNGKAIPKWIAYYANTNEARAYFLATGKQTTNLASISKKNLGALPVPLPPVDIQESIVAEIDTQLSRLDETVTTLQGIQAKLKQARASILKAAVEGRLVETEAELARRNATDYENAEALLQRSLAEKKRLFQKAQLQAGRRKTWKEPPRPDCHDTSTKPEGWIITSMEHIADVSGGLAKDSKIISGESLPYLRVANVQRGILDLEHIKTIICPFEKVDCLLLQKGDILLNEGGDRDKLGRGWVWNGEISRCIHQNHVFKARLALPAIQPRFISHYCNTLGESYFQNEGKQTTNLASISLSKVRALPIALPPASEQLRILEEIDRRFSVLDQVEATVTASLARCGKLRQAILKQAFEGRLVPVA